MAPQPGGHDERRRGCAHSGADATGRLGFFSDPVNTNGLTASPKPRHPVAAPTRTARPLPCSNRRPRRPRWVRRPAVRLRRPRRRGGCVRDLPAERRQLPQLGGRGGGHRWRYADVCGQYLQHPQPRSGSDNAVVRISAATATVSVDGHRSAARRSWHSSPPRSSGSPHRPVRPRTYTRSATRRSSRVAPPLPAPPSGWTNNGSTTGSGGSLQLTTATVD